MHKMAYTFTVESKFTAIRSKCGATIYLRKFTWRKDFNYESKCRERNDVIAAKKPMNKVDKKQTNYCLRFVSSARDMAFLINNIGQFTFDTKFVSWVFSPRMGARSLQPSTFYQTTLLFNYKHGVGRVHCFCSLDIDRDCIISDQNVAAAIDSFDRHRLKRWKRSFSTFLSSTFRNRSNDNNEKNSENITSLGGPKSKALAARVRHTAPRAFRIKWKVWNHFTFDFPLSGEWIKRWLLF